MKKLIALRFLLMIALVFLFLIPQGNSSYAIQPLANSWSLVGLENYVIHSLAVDPNNQNILYAGTAGNGIFKSINKGTTWNSINNGLGNYSGYFTSIVIDPNNSNIIYAGGVGLDYENGTGIFKSTNSGTMWKHANTGIDALDVNNIVLDSNNSTVLYAAIGNGCGSVYKSLDSAVTWTRGIGLACDPTVVKINPNDSNILYSRTGWSQGINVSTDGGINWNNVSGLGSYGAFYGFAIDPFNSNNLYINTDTGIYKSTDAGINWTLSNPSIDNVYKALIVDPARPNTIYAGQNTAGDVYMATNSGTMWTNISNGLPSIGIKLFTIPTNDNNLLYAGTDAGIYVLGLQNASNINLNVPLIKQTSDQWGSEIYDLANKWAPRKPTINAWGCALTSATMVLNYYGINKLPNGQILDPGTLNGWLKSQKDGYLGTGWVNWLSISRLSKLARSINEITRFNALQYTRAGNDKNQLTDDIKNSIPDIVEVPGHFVVAKGISGDTFNINDPYYDRDTLNDGYSNTFISLGRFIPSNTDLSYIMFTTNQETTIIFEDDNNNAIGEIFHQQPLTNDKNPFQTNSSIEMFYLPNPQSGNYKLKISSPNNNIYDLHSYFYDQNGNVNVSNQTGIINPNKTDNFTIKFDKLNSNNSRGTKIVSFQSLIDDITEVKKQKLITPLIATDLIKIIQTIKKNYERRQNQTVKMQLGIFEYIIKSLNKLHLIKNEAYQLFIYDVSCLKNYL